MPRASAPLWREVLYALRVSVYYFGILGLMAAVWHVAPPWVLALALVVVFGSAMLELGRRSKIFKNRLAVHPDTSDISPNLGKIMADLYARAGLNPADYPLYDFRREGAAPAAAGAKSATTMEGMAELPTAAVLDLGRPVLAVSAPLLALMDDEEERAVLAHEFVHLRESHVYWRYVLQLFSSVVSWMLTLLCFVVFCAAGWQAAGIALAAGAVAWYAMRALQLPLPYAGKKQSQLSMAEKAEQNALWRRRTHAGTIAAVAVMTFYNPAYLALHLASWALRVLMGVIVRGLSRTNEYRADAGIVTLGANPLSLMTALRKLDLLETRARGGAVQTRGRWRYYLFATHPVLAQRLGALRRVAVRAGFGAAEIRVAAEGPLDVAEEHQYPLWLVQSMQAQ